MALPNVVIDFAPIFPVADIDAALDHYQRLGFHASPHEPGDEYGFAERDQVYLHVTYRPTSRYPDNGIAVAYLVVHDADALFTE